MTLTRGGRKGSHAKGGELRSGQICNCSKGKKGERRRPGGVN